MRVWLCSLLLLAAPAARAQEERIGALVERLSSEDFDVRADAFRRLLLMGEGIIPKLERFRVNDVEGARLLKELIRRGAALRLYVTGPSGVQRIGAPVLLDVRLVNQTDETYIIPVVESVRRIRIGGLRRVVNRSIGASAFAIHVVGAKQRRLRPQQVKLLHPKGQALILQPDGQLQVQLTFAGADSPFRRPGKYILSIVYHATGASKAMLGAKNRVTQLERIPSLRLASPRIEVEAAGRTADQLDADLKSGDGRRVAAAVRELKMRDDDDVLDVLRKHINHPMLRVRAIERIGQQARKKDLDFLRALAASDRYGKQAQLAAIAALGHYTGHRKARLRLASLAQDPTLRDAAVKALTHHKAAATIDLFVRLLQRNFRNGTWSQTARGAILEWTGIHVENRKGEIDAFEKWWRANRRRWISANRK